MKITVKDRTLRKSMRQLGESDIKWAAKWLASEELV